MKPIEFKGQEIILAAPSNWDAKEKGECLGLPIVRVDSIVMSCWKPTLKERLKLIFGKPITLSVYSGQSQPPVCLEVGYPAEDRS